MEDWRVPARTAQRLTAQPSEHPLLAEEMRHPVRENHENGAEDAFEETDRGAQAPVASQNALKIHEGVQYIPSLRANRRLLKQNLLETRCKNVAKVQNQQQNGNSADTWQRHMPHPSPGSGAVD